MRRVEDEIFLGSWKDRGLRHDGEKVTIARILQVELDDERVHHRQITEFGG